MEQHPPLKESHLSKHNCQSTDTLRTGQGSARAHGPTPHQYPCFSKPPTSRTVVIRMVCEADNSAAAGLSVGTGMPGSHWMSPQGAAPRSQKGFHSTPTPAFPLKRSGFPQPKADLPEDGTWDGNTPSTEAEVKSLCLSPCQGLQLSHQTHVGVFLPLFWLDMGAQD